MERDVQNGMPQQPAAATQSSSTPGSVAPPRNEQEQGQTPGAVQGQENRQPADPNPQVAQGQGEQPETPPQPDYRAQYEQERQERLRRDQELNQYRQTVSQIQQYAQDQQQNQQLQQQVQMMLAHADNLPSSEASSYLKNQVTNMLAQQRIQAQQQVQQVRQESEQQVRQIAAPQYADHLIQSLGIPAEARQELLNLRDPDLMYQQAPIIKQRYDQWEQQKSEWERQQQQLGRTQEVNALRQNGLASIGGQGAGGTVELEVSDDPDERAMQVLSYLRNRDGQSMGRTP